MKKSAELKVRVQLSIAAIEVGTVVTIKDNFAASTYFYIYTEDDTYKGYVYSTGYDNTWVFDPIRAVNRDELNDFFVEINNGEHEELEFIDPFKANIPETVLNDIFN